LPVATPRRSSSSASSPAPSTPSSARSARPPPRSPPAPSWRRRSTAKRAIITEIADRQQAGQLTKNTLHLLVDRRRIKYLTEISATLRQMNDARRGLLRAEVTSATALPDAYYARLGEQLERMTGRKVAIDKKTDPSLLGGVVTRIGDLIYDGSLRARLGALRSTLTN
jgi:F-type H+-transporting ATPase subunit delta